MHVLVRRLQQGSKVRRQQGCGVRPDTFRIYGWWIRWRVERLKVAGVSFDIATVVGEAC
jgi:hypothetical protein